MTINSMTETQMKTLFKQALIELFEERRDLFYDLFAEVMEDYGLTLAIQEGLNTEPASRAEIFAILEQ
jgi:hypothetical protein